MLNGFKLICRNSEPIRYENKKSLEVFVLQKMSDQVVERLLIVLRN